MALEEPFAGFSELFAALAAAHGQHGGVEDASRATSYRVLHDEADALALTLGRHVCNGRVALLLPRSVDFVSALVAASRVGATPILLRPPLRHDELVDAVAATDPDVLVTSPALCGRVRAAGISVNVCMLDRGRIHGLIRSAVGRSPSVLPHLREYERTVVLLTSGTTGAAKGVVHLQRSLIDNALSVARQLELASSDVSMIGLPLHHAYGLNHLLAHVLVGGTSVLAGESPIPGLFGPPGWQARVTNIPFVPTTLRLFLGQNRPSKLSFPKLGLVVSAGGACTKDLRVGLKLSMPQVRLSNNYGQTEAGPRVTSGIMSAGDANGWVGRPLPGISIRIVTEDGSETPGTEGEVRVKTPSVMLGYLGAATETAQISHDGWLRTGDVGALDHAGNLRLNGRLSEVLKCGGVRATTREIEDALLAHPSVAEAAVVPIPHEALGEVAKAFVVRSGAASAATLKRFCRRFLTPTKVPREIVFVDTLPRTESGKILKRLLT